MSEVHLAGTIPVTVVVIDGAVDRVVAHDESFEYDVNDEGFYVVAGTSPDASNEEVAAAHLAAENVSWPAWEWT